MKKFNKDLAVCIPTFERAALLEDCLSALIPLVKKDRIRIFVSDNASTDSTANAVKKLQPLYDGIIYRRNRQDIGPDRNFEKALRASETRYAWLIGDGTRLTADAVRTVLSIIPQGDFDAIVVNGEDRVKDVKSALYTDHSRLLSEIGWHMTQMSSLIFSRSIINNGNFAGFYNSNFIQTGVILEGVAGRVFSISWCDKPLLKNVIFQKANSWDRIAFDVFIHQWIAFILSLPLCYSFESKLKCIKDHGVKSGLFSLPCLLDLRGKGFFGIRLFIRDFKWFPLVADLNRFVIFLIAIAPIQKLYYFYKRARYGRK
jgi:abequosyltransferase